MWEEIQILKRKNGNYYTEQNGNSRAENFNSWSDRDSLIGMLNRRFEMAEVNFKINRYNLPYLKTWEKIIEIQIKPHRPMRQHYI